MNICCLLKAVVEIMDVLIIQVTATNIVGTLVNSDTCYGINKDQSLRENNL